MTADRLVWAIFWILAFCIFVTTNLGLFVLELFLLVGLAVWYKWFKYKEKKEGITYKEWE